MDVKDNKINTTLTTPEKTTIKTSEDMARKMNTVAHYYDHADQVRDDAVYLATKEGLHHRDIFLLEVAALWHDIGLDYVEDRSTHPQKSSDLFFNTFPDTQMFAYQEKKDLSFLLLYHDKYIEAQRLTGDTKLLKMLRILIDADTLELLGERGFQRAKETQKDRNWPTYNPENPTGETHNYSSKDFDERFKLKREGKVSSGIEPTLVGQLNFQISCADLLFTKSAKEKGSLGAKFLKNKIEVIINSSL